MDVEAEVARLLQAAEFKQAATVVVEAYGPGVLGFLATMLGDQAEASDAFAQACENLWKGLSGFEGRSTVKTWFYTLARNAGLRLRRSPNRPRFVPFSEVSDVIQRVRSRTAQHLRSEIKTGVAAIRDELSVADRALLVLRVDRGMSWLDAAQVMSEAGASDAQLARTAARLRQRFRTVKELIRKRAREIGLLGDGDDRIEVDAEP